MRTPLTIGELCAGYGGLGMGISSVLDAETAWVADVCKFDKDSNASHYEPHRSPCSILAHRFPSVPNLGDITKLDWTTVPRVDILAGGTPCQDLSHAGKRAGMTEGTRSNLWVAMREAIAVLRPSLVVWENVGGAASAEADSDLEPCPGCMGDPRDRGPVLRALGRVVGDLSSLGYVGSVRSLRAADVDAPHGRLRYFLAAHPEGDTRWIEHRGPVGDADESRLEGRGDSGRRAGERSAWPTGRQPALLPSPRTSDTNGAGDHGDGGLDLRTAVSLLPTPSVSDGTGGHLSRSGDRSDELLLPGVAKQLALMPTPRAIDGTKGGPNQRGSSGDLMLPSAVALLPTPAVNDMGAAYNPETWDEWTEEMKAKHGNGNGHGPSLNVEVQRLLPTPVTDPDSGNGHARDLGTEARLLPNPMVGSTSPDAHGQISGQYRTQMAEAFTRWGDYAEAIARWEAATRPAPEPVMVSEGYRRRITRRRAGKDKRPVGMRGSLDYVHRFQLSPAFSEWMMGLPAGWVTDVPGITRNEALKALGNGVVPQQVAAALGLLLDTLSRVVAA